MQQRKTTVVTFLLDFNKTSKQILESNKNTAIRNRVLERKQNPKCLESYTTGYRQHVNEDWIYTAKALASSHYLYWRTEKWGIRLLKG